MSEAIEKVNQNGNVAGAAKMRAGKDVGAAERLLQSYGLDLKLTAKGRTCPPGENDCLTGQHRHGNQFTVLLKRITGPVKIRTSDGFLRKRPIYGFTFEYWAKDVNSLPTISDIVRYIAEAQTWACDPDAVFDELGPMTRPSKAFAMAKLSKRFKEFLTADEVAALNKFL